LMNALNRVYETEETRSWWWRFVLSTLLAIPVIAALLSATLLVLAAGGAFPRAVEGPWAIGRWVLAILLVWGAVGLLVPVAPAERRAKKWTSVGTGLVVAGWLLEAVAFRFYLGMLANFKTATGSLTVALVVTAYFYIASLILLLGIELDEQAREEAGEAER